MNDRREPIVMTDKKKTKILPCSFPECGQPLIVNKFESAARARCPDHKAVASSSYREQRTEDQQVIVNRALGQLCCPFHPEEPMSLLGVEQTGKGRAFKFSFRCRLSECCCVVDIRPDWAPLVALPTHPNEFTPLIKAYNEARGGIRQ